MGKPARPRIFGKWVELAIPTKHGGFRLLSRLWCTFRRLSAGPPESRRTPGRSLRADRSHEGMLGAGIESMAHRPRFHNRAGGGARRRWARIGSGQELKPLVVSTVARSHPPRPVGISRREDGLYLCDIATFLGLSVTDRLGSTRLRCPRRAHGGPLTVGSSDRVHVH
jgi:hypothetical protein